MIAVTGASVPFCRLPSRTRGFSRSFAAKVITNTMRTGKQFALVGPQRIRSYTAASCSRETGLSNHLFWVRALRKIVSSAESSSGVTIRCLLALKATVAAHYSSRHHAPRYTPKYGTSLGGGVYPTSLAFLRASSASSKVTSGVVLTLLTVAPKTIKNLNDLKGKTVSVDLPNGGTFVTALTVFERL